MDLFQHKHCGLVSCWEDSIACPECGCKYDEDDPCCTGDDDV